MVSECAYRQRWSGDSASGPGRASRAGMGELGAAANALVLVPRGEGELAAGADVSWLPL